MIAASIRRVRNSCVGCEFKFDAKWRSWRAALGSKSKVVASGVLASKRPHRQVYQTSPQRAAVADPIRGVPMSSRLIAAALVGWFATCHAAIADPMTLDFSWRGAKGCVTLFPNPEFHLRGIPAGAKILLLTLTQGVREMGGQELPVPENGVLPSGTFRTFAPCTPGVYQWTAQVKSATGEVLSEAHKARFYPTDELAQDKP
ncbi:hypothetical protein [Bradyrhizobium lablabi]|uniref:hypothetical protein n=1 Tax=Bradyrhizobium lablabi TaxID=722472 RepID=UPI001BA6BE21|nr:hypothetical protein [Bradyrhizobium lablabi]MBR0697917.1 hypothetical protein [Bradyrhizobium lablabi]